MTHPLLEYATARPYREKPELPNNAEYDLARGIWLCNGFPLVEMEDFRSGRVSKKCDQETGEDQKGE